MKYIGIHCELFLCLSKQLLSLAILQNHALHLYVELCVYFALDLRAEGLCKLLQNVLYIFQIQTQLFFSISLLPLSFLTDQLAQGDGKRHMQWRVDHPPMERRSGVHPKRRNVFIFIHLGRKRTRCVCIVGRMQLFLFPEVTVH